MWRHLFFSSPALLLLPAVAACTPTKSADPPAPASSAPAAEPELEVSKAVQRAPAPKPKRAQPPQATSVPRGKAWGYVLPVGFGVRRDKAGQGQFLAPRYHGKHNGVDLLAPLGTPVLAACSGQATSGTSASFGKWVHLVCEVPEPYGSDSYASFFYSHLSKISVSKDGFKAVERGAQIGAVGKTGNASGSSVAPHLHLELAILGSQEEAEGETHSGRNQKNTSAADRFVRSLEARCMIPRGITAKAGSVRRERRVDPFLSLWCLGAEPPQYTKADPPLGDSSTSPNDYYLVADAGG